MTRNFFLWTSIENAVKLSKCWKNLKSIFFAFKLSALCLQIWPGYRTAKIKTWGHIVHLKATSKMAKVHNVMSRITSLTANYVPVSRTNLKANCMFSLKVKKCFLDFFSTFKTSKRFLEIWSYPTIRNKRKKFLFAPSSPSCQFSVSIT